MNISTASKIFGKKFYNDLDIHYFVTLTLAVFVKTFAFEKMDEVINNQQAPKTFLYDA